MAADEQEPQDVVPVVCAVEPLGEAGLHVLEVRDQMLLGHRLLLRPAPDGVDGGVASDEDQPRGRVARRPFLGPGPKRPQTGVLEGFLRRFQVAEITQQRAEHLGPGRRQRLADPVQVGHVGRVQGWKVPTGLIS